MSFLTAVLWLAVWQTGGAEDVARPEPADNPGLRDELVRRVERDQKARMVLIEFMKEHAGTDFTKLESLEGDAKVEFEKIRAGMTQADRENTAWLQQVVIEHGWPTPELVGKRGAHAAWLLVQHADRDPKFQRRCLDLMTACPPGTVSPQNLAYLTDRVLLAEGKQQQYGTQFVVKDGQLVASPMEPLDEVEKRRAKIGLPPLAEYRKMVEKMYGISPAPAAKKK